VTVASTDYGAGVDIEFDDDKSRLDVEALHAFLSTHAYWAIGRPLETQQRLVDEASRVVGVYEGGRQIGFCRSMTDGVSFAYRADVYVLPEYRGRGLGEQLVRT
jgi:GNAT superfamily N-acetyltransferase